MTAGVIAVPFQTTTTQQPATATAIPIVNSYGQPIPRLWGRTKVRGWPLWSSAPVSTAGAVAPGTQLSFALGCGYPAPDAVSVVISRIWVAGTLIYDVTGASQVPAASQIPFTAYPGSETQGIDPTIAAIEGPATTPAFRGLIYVVFKNFDTTPYGGMLPEIDIEVTQAEEIVAVVTPYAVSSPAATYRAWFPDYSRNEIVALTATGTPMDVYDLKTKALKFSNSNAGDIGISDIFHVAPVYRNKDPYFYSKHSGSSNSEPIYLVNYETGAVVGSIGTESSSLTPSSTNILYPNALCSGNPVGDNDDTLFAGTLVDHYIYLLNRKGTTLSVRNWFQPPGSHSIGYIVNADINMTAAKPVDSNGNSVTPPAIDNTKFSIAYYAYGNIIGRAVAADQETTVINGVLSTTDDPATSVFYANKFVEGKLSEGVADLITLEASSTIRAIWAGPADDPYVACVVELSDGTYHYRKFDTAFSKLAGKGFSTNAIIDMSYFVQLIDIVLPLGDFGQFYSTQTQQQSSQRAGTTIVTYPHSSSLLVMLDWSNGSTVTYDRSSSSFEDYKTPTTIYDRQFQDSDLYDSQTDLLYYLTQGGAITPPLVEPGQILLHKLNFTGNGLNIGDYLKSLCLAAGYDDGDISLAGLTDIFIQGSIVNVAVNLIDLLTQVCGVFRIDIVPSDATIKFQRKTRGVSMVLDETFLFTDVAALEQGSNPQFLDNTRDTTQSLPAQLALSYLDGDNQNAIGTQTAKRTKVPVVTTATIASTTFSIPIIMTAAEALYWATYALFDMWNGAKSTVFRVSQKWLAFEPGDLFSLANDAGDVVLYKGAEFQLNADFSIQITGTAFAQFDQFKARAPASVTINGSAGGMPDIASGAGQQAGTGQTIAAPQPSTDILFIDNVMVEFANENQIVLVKTFAAGFGAVTQYSVAVPYRWMTQAQSTLYEAGYSAIRISNIPTLFSGPLNTCGLQGYVGKASQLAAPATLNEFDKTNSVTVQFINAMGNVSASRTDFLSGINRAVVGNIGRWELIYFRDVVDNGNANYTFSYLMRGMNGSGLHVGDHQANDYFIIIDDTFPLDGTVSAATPASSPLVPMFKAILGIDTTQDQVTPLTDKFWAAPYQPVVSTIIFNQAGLDNGKNFSLDGGPIKPWAPVNIIAAYSGSDIVFDWCRRDRSGVDLHDGDDIVPSTDAWTFFGGDGLNHYAMDIFDGGGTLKRTLTATSETVTYTSAEQSTDGFSSPTSLHVTLYQVSQLVGRGWPADKTVAIT